MSHDFEPQLPSGCCVFTKKSIARSTPACAAAREVRSGAGDVAILVRPTKIQQVTAVASAREVMPQKSTFFYPKLASGMVIHPLIPPEPLVP